MHVKPQDAGGGQVDRGALGPSPGPSPHPPPPPPYKHPPHPYHRKSLGPPLGLISLGLNFHHRDFSEPACPVLAGLSGARLPTGQVCELWEEVFHRLFFKLMQSLVLGEPRPATRLESVAGLTYRSPDPPTPTVAPAGLCPPPLLRLTSLYR